MKNNISKITLISTLLISNVAPAQNFHTCVPKKEWVEKVIQEKEYKGWGLFKNFELLVQNRTTSISKPILDLADVYKFVVNDSYYILDVPRSIDVYEKKIEELIKEGVKEEDYDEEIKLYKKGKKMVKISNSCEFMRQGSFNKGIIPINFLCDIYVDGSFLGRTIVPVGEKLTIKIYNKKKGFLQSI